MGVPRLLTAVYSGHFHSIARKFYQLTMVGVLRWKVLGGPCSKITDGIQKI